MATVDELLDAARDRLDRLSPADAREALADGAVLVDIRSESQRAADGEILGAVLVPSNVLEWRLDPASEHRDAALASYDRQVILICDAGYQSSLAAATLQDLGIERATNVVGGFRAWRDAGLG